MRVPKALIGRYVEIKWHDPIGVQRAPIDKAPKGLKGLATWLERGVLDDITEDVVRIVHSAGCEPGTGTIDEISYTLVPESLIIEVTTFNKENTNGG